MKLLLSQIPIATSSFPIFKYLLAYFEAIKYKTCTVNVEIAVTHFNIILFKRWTICTCRLLRLYGHLQCNAIFCDDVSNDLAR